MYQTRVVFLALLRYFPANKIPLTIFAKETLSEHNLNSSDVAFLSRLHFISYDSRVENHLDVVVIKKRL